MQDYHSKPVTSPQTGPHDKLVPLVQKHISSRYQKPYQQHNLTAFRTLLEHVNNGQHQKFFLDSCCGTGLSTQMLAAKNPECLVIGVDQSIKRLEKISEGLAKAQNCLLLQANCEDIWRLCVEHNITFEQHTILYPNPWPKITHLKRRWHGHAVFPSLKALAPKTILRSNWSLYLEEFSLAWEVLTGDKYTVEPLEVKEALTLFEKKYAASGQTLFELEVLSKI